MMLSVMSNQKLYLFRRNQLRVPIIFESVFQEGTKKKASFIPGPASLENVTSPEGCWLDFFSPAGDKNRHMNRDPDNNVASLRLIKYLQVLPDVVMC